MREFGDGILLERRMFCSAENSAVSMGSPAKSRESKHCVKLDGCNDESEVLRE